MRYFCVMAKKLPNKVAAWLTDDMLDHIDSKRDWRTRSEYIRALVDADMGDGPTRARRGVATPKQARWQHVRDVVSAQLIDEGFILDDLIGPQIEHMGEEGFWLSYLTNADCIRRMDAHEAKERPA